MPNVKGENPPYSDYQQQLEITVVMLSFQRKSEHHIAVAKKQGTCEVCKSQGLCSRHMLKANLFEMSRRNWVKTTLCDLEKSNWYIMLISCWSGKSPNVKPLFTNHFKYFFFFKCLVCLVWKKSCMSCMKTLFEALYVLYEKSLVYLVWKLCLISFPGQDYYRTTNYTKVLLNYLCNTPNFVIQLLWSYKIVFSVG